MIRFVIGAVLALASLLAAYFLEGGMAAELLGLSAFLITFFVPLLAVLAVWPFSAWWTAWKDAARPSATSDRSVAIWRFSEVACYVSGVLASLAGGMLIMNHWDRPAENLARAFGVLLIGPLYGTFFALVCRILRARVEVNSAS